jgi:ubiquinone/menaquinone biosynthesis C-methylase UbiE
MGTHDQETLRVMRSREQAIWTYDKLSRFYDSFIGVFEKKHRNKALEMLQIKKGETILEIGFGTGQCLIQIVERVGEKGKIFGIDISSGMLRVAAKRIDKAGLRDRVELYLGDALQMPYSSDKFDAVFLSFTLELFDTPEIPKILDEIKRVLKPQGRLGLVSMSREHEATVPLKIYEWFHKKFPAYADCRPIFVKKSIQEAGYQIQYIEKAGLFGVPLTIITASSPE